MYRYINLLVIVDMIIKEENIKRIKPKKLLVFKIFSFIFLYLYFTGTMCLSITNYYGNFQLQFLLLLLSLFPMISNMLHRQQREKHCYNGNRNNIIKNKNENNVINIVIIVSSDIIIIIFLLFLLLWQFTLRNVTCFQIFAS